METRTQRFYALDIEPLPWWGASISAIEACPDS
jgi:hypothetical protein